MDFMEKIAQMKEELEALKTGGVDALNKLQASRAKQQESKVIDTLKDVEKAVRDLQPKEQTALDKQLDEFLNGGSNARLLAAKEKFLKLDTRSQAEFRKNNPELYEAMFPSPKVEVSKPTEALFGGVKMSYDQIKAEIMADPTKLSKVPMSVWNYANLADKDFYEFMKGAGEMMRAEQTFASQNPIYKKLKAMEAEEARKAVEEGK